MHITRSGYEFSFWPGYERSATPQGAWVRCRGGDLPTPIELRIAPSADGRWVVTGLMLGEEFDQREITSKTLRAIKLREIVAELLEDYDPDAPPEWMNFASTFGYVLRANATAAGHVAKTAQRGPDEATLREFARSYRAELARRPHGAMTAAAKAFNISRATANRWTQEARRSGFLPDVPREAEQDAGVQQPDQPVDVDE
jgi:hypothetical protein